MPARNSPFAGGPAPWLGLLSALLVIVVYLPALTTGFNADDFLILWRIKSIAGLAQPLAYFKFAFYEYFRPLTFLSYAMDWRLWGVNPFGFHLTNLALHVANTLLLLQFGRRLIGPRGALIAALLFGIHPTWHEAVYWIAARFDLLATFFVLVALVCFQQGGRGWRAIGLAAFACGLLSKESALAFLIIAPAMDVFVDRRSWRETVRRLLPLLTVTACYGALRVFGADIAAAGGERRLPKLAMTAAAIALILYASWLRGRRTQTQLRPDSDPVQTQVRPGKLWFTPAVFGIVGAALLAVPATFPWAAEKLGFLSHVTFYAMSPIVFPSPPPEWFMPETFRQVIPHLAISGVAVIAGLLWLRARDSSRGVRLFLIVFIAAALLPVLSMTGGLRYLYLPGVGIALAFAGFLDTVAAPRRVITAILAVTVLVSVQQLLQAARAWRTASTMTRDGVALMGGSVTRCGEDDVLLLTTPVGIGKVYANFSWDAFDVSTNCAPRNFWTLLRVMRTDVHVSVSTPEAETIEMRVPQYAGNIVASKDLRNFGVPVVAGQSVTLDTSVGRLEMFAEGTTQVFRLSLTQEAASAKRFYFTDGRIVH